MKQLITILSVMALTLSSYAVMPNFESKKLEKNNRKNIREKKKPKVISRKVMPNGKEKIEYEPRIKRYNYQPEFESVMAYYHVDAAGRRLTSLGYWIPELYELKVDPASSYGPEYNPWDNEIALDIDGVDVARALYSGRPKFV